MKCNAWTIALIGAGLVSVPAITRADEATNAVLTALSATTISGYVDTSAEWNPGRGDANLPPFGYNNGKADGFNLDYVGLILEKDVAAADTWGAGYKVDVLLGPDANLFATQSINSSGKSDFGVKQAYVALHAPVGNGLDLKVGVWDTIIGYEVFYTANDPNFTRSYGYSMEPTTHTGVLGTYQVCETVTANFGVADAFGPTVNQRTDETSANSGFNESFKTYMGSLTFTAPTNMAWLGGSTLSGCIISGWNSGLLNTAASISSEVATFGEKETSYYFGATLNTPFSWLKGGLAADMLDPHNDAHGKDWVVGAYLTVQATEKLSFNGRAEYMENNNVDSLFVNSYGLSTVSHRTTELTATAQYDLWKNVLSRVEFRWDHDAGGQGVWGGTVPYGTAGTVTPGPGEGGKKNELLFLANVVYKF